MSGSLRRIAWWFLLLVTTSCAERESFVGRLARERSADGGVALPWGTWAAQLAVPACPAGAELTVDTTADELEGGATLSERGAAGDRLSLAEALWLAANTRGPHVIRFDPAVFPVEAPATILVQGLFALPQGLADTCLDARDRGVVVHWTHSARSGQAGDRAYLWGLGAGSLQVGLQLRAIEQGQEVSDGAQVAGCRYFSLPGDYLHPASVLVRPFNGTIGPGNVLLGEPVGVLGSGGTVTGNFIGYDPRTGQNEPGAVGVVLSGDARVEDNVISAVRTGIQSVALSLTVHRNTVGDTADGAARLHQPETAVELLGVGRQVVAVNTLRALGTGVLVRTSAATTISRNRISAAQGIAFVGVPEPFAPPTLTSVDGAGVHGTCAVGGGVELFAGAQGSAEQFLGTTSCLGGNFWTMGVTPPPGRDLVATLTNPELRTSAFSAPFPVP